MALKVQFLGTGTSTGIPMIGCKCAVCTSKDPRDKRRRCGIYVRSATTSFIVDTPPELRDACLEYGIDDVKAVFITHVHMDHVAAFDDVRRFNTLNGRVPMPCFAVPKTLENLQDVFPYISDRGGKNGLFRPMIEFTPVTGPFDFADVRVIPIPVVHGPVTNGFRFESGGRSFAYVPDCHEIPSSSLELLKGVDVMILNCLKEKEHPTHLTLAAAMRYMEMINPARGFFVHMTHWASHAEMEDRLPSHLRPAYDGLQIEV